jgi:hypothetical protein
MPHPKRLPVTQLFRMLEEQLHTSQRDVAAHLGGLSRQAVNNWAKGMSLPQRYRVPFLTFVDTKIGEALTRAEAQSKPTRTLLEMTPLDEMRQNLYTALLMWRDECLADRGVLRQSGQKAIESLNLHWKDSEIATAESLAQLEENAKQFLRVVRTLKRLDTESRMPLRERWGQPAGNTSLQEFLWRIYRWATGDEEEDESNED